VRAGLVTLAIAVGLADGCPLPTIGDAPPSLRPVVRAAKTVRRVALAPFRPAGELLRLHQRWKLFPTAQREQVRMWVETSTHESRAWQLVYRPQDDEHDLLADRIEYRRLRAAWNPGTRKTHTGYGPFAAWLAGELFARDPAIERVRVQMEAIELQPEHGGFVGLGTFTRSRIERRPGTRRGP
jgi:hypothetical protein